MTPHRAFVLAAAISTPMVASAWADLTQAWVQRYNNTQANDADYGEAIAVDSTGAVYMAGFTFYEVDSGYFVPRFLTIRYEPDGTQAWVRDYSTNNFWAAAAWLVAVDPSNDDAVVAGGVNGHEDWGVVKYSTAGVEQWAVTYEADSYYLTEPADVFVDDAGNIYLTGDIGSFGGADPQAPVLMYSGAGQLLVSERYVGPAGDGAAGRAIGVDAAGNIYIAGSAPVPGLASELFLAKFSPTGALVWERTFGTGSQVSHDGARDLIVDESGDVIVMGYLGFNTSAGVDVVVRKYDSDGGMIWSTTYGAGGGLDEVVYSMERDATGNIFAAGYAEVTNGQSDVLVIMFDEQGRLEWASTHGGLGNDFDYAADIAVGPAGGVLIAGSIRPFGGVPYAFAAEVNPEDGAILDIKEYGGPTDGDTGAAAIALGPQDEVYITGSTPDFSTDIDAFTIRYDRGENLVGATLADMTVAFGQHIAGTLAELQISDNFYVRLRSRPGFTASEPNLIDVRVGATTNVVSPQSLHLAVEGRVNSAGGTMRVRLKNWSTNQFQQVHQYPIGTTESTVLMPDLSAMDRVRPSDGRIEVSLRASMLATFSAQGFDLFLDHVEIAVGQ